MQEAIEAGFDENLILDNLSLSPAQRMEVHQQALDLILELERAKKREESK